MGGGTASADYIDVPQEWIEDLNTPVQEMEGLDVVVDEGAWVLRQIYRIGKVPSMQSQSSVEVAPYLKNNISYVSLRSISNDLYLESSKLKWNSKTGVLTFKTNDLDLKLQLNSKKAIKNNSEITMSASPQLKDGRLMLPLRDVGNLLGANVIWNSEKSRIEVYAWVPSKMDFENETGDTVENSNRHLEELIEAGYEWKQ